MMELTNAIIQPHCYKSVSRDSASQIHMDALTIAIPMVASEKGSPAIFARLKLFFPPPPNRPWFSSIFIKDGESSPKPGIECV